MRARTKTNGEIEENGDKETVAMNNLTCFQIIYHHKRNGRNLINKITHKAVNTVIHKAFGIPD